MVSLWCRVVAVSVLVAMGIVVTAAASDAQVGPPVDCGPGWILIGDTCFNQTTTTASLVGPPIPGIVCLGDWVLVGDRCEYRPPPGRTPPAPTPTAPPETTPTPAPDPQPIAAAPSNAPPASRTTQ